MQPGRRQRVPRIEPGSEGRMDYVEGGYSGKGGAGGGASYSVVTITFNAATGVVDLGNSFLIEGEIASAPGRFRLYRDAAGRTKDTFRQVYEVVPMEVGMILEDLFTPAILEVEAISAPGAPNGDTLCYWAWSGAIGATLQLKVTKIR